MKIKKQSIPFLVLAIMGILIETANAWVGGQLMIRDPKENSIISGNTTFNITITGSYDVHKLSIFGKAVDTSVNKFQLIKESTECGFWDEQKMCSIAIETAKIEDSNIWQFYALAGNASNSEDTVKSVTITNVVVNNSIPALQPLPYITPNVNEVVRTEDVSFGAMVNQKTVTSCLVTFTSNANPGKRVYITEYEKGEYCNVTIKNVPDGSYSFTFAATDGLDVSPTSLPQTFIVDTSKSKQETKAQEQPAVKSSNNLIAENWMWIVAAIALLIVFNKRKKRR